MPDVINTMKNEHLDDLFSYFLFLCFTNQVDDCSENGSLPAARKKKKKNLKAIDDEWWPITITQMPNRIYTGPHLFWFRQRLDIWNLKKNKQKTKKKKTDHFVLNCYPISFESTWSSAGRNLNQKVWCAKKTKRQQHHRHWERESSDMTSYSISCFCGSAFKLTIENEHAPTGSSVESFNILLLLSLLLYSGCNSRTYQVFLYDDVAG